MLTSATLPSIVIVPVTMDVTTAITSNEKLRESLWAEFGQLKIADSTRKQYVKAIENLCQFAYNGSATPERIAEFLVLDRYAAIEMVLRYRRHSINRNLAPSTINVRLAVLDDTVNGFIRAFGEGWRSGMMEKK